MKVTAFGRLARNVAAEVRKPKAQRRERPAAVLEVDRRLLQEGDPDANARILASARPGERPALLPEGLRVYDLRHTCASLLIAGGASIKAVQAQLGHKTASMTLDLYGHLFPDETERLAEHMDRARSAVLAALQQHTATRTVVPMPSSASG